MARLKAMALEESETWEVKLPVVEVRLPTVVPESVEEPVTEREEERVEAPETARVEERLEEPETARVEERVDAPAMERVPEPVVERLPEVVIGPVAVREVTPERAPELTTRPLMVLVVVGPPKAPEEVIVPPPVVEMLEEEEIAPEVAMAMLEARSLPVIGPKVGSPAALPWRTVIVVPGSVPSNPEEVFVTTPAVAREEKVT